MKRKLQIALATALTFGMSQVATTAFADNSALGVDPIFPASQIDTKTGYYDLKVEPGQEQNLEMTLMNDGDKPMLVHMSANPASTNDNGVIEYGKNKIKVDESMTANVGSMITVPKRVTIPAHGTIKVSAKLLVQSQRFNGIAVGGISFVTDPEAGKTQKSGVQIRNRYAYDMGVVLHESDETVTPNLRMHQVRPATVNYRTAILARLQNDQPAFITDMKSHAVVYTAKQGHWHFKQTFVVAADQARTMNQRNVTISHWVWWQIALMILAVILLILLIIFLVRRDRKRTAELRRLQMSVSEVTNNEGNQN